VSADGQPLRVVVVDDGSDYIELCHTFLRRYRYLTNCDYSHPCWECEREPTCDLKHAHDWQELTEIMARHGDAADVVLLDVNFDLPADRLLPEAARDAAREDPKALRKLQRRQGFHVLDALRARWRDLPVVLMTDKRAIAHDDPALVAQLEASRFTEMFADEGVNAQSLAARIEALARQRAPAEDDRGRFLWGNAPAMRRLRQWLEVFSEGDQPILILGETGTGKSFLAEHGVHALARPGAVFCSLDLSALPEHLVAAELFGTSRGAFSDAVDRPGRFEFAHGGTLFLDEIGNLSLDTQKRLLGVIQDRRVTRLGENRDRPVDVKLVVATNEDLEARVREGRFRADLYQRLNPAARVTLPPLRERLEDLPDLLAVITRRVFSGPGNRRLLDRFGALFGLPAPVGAEVVIGRRTARRSDAVIFQLAGAAETTLRSAEWPGNVRQLELVWTNAVTYQLAEQIAAGRVATAPVIAMDAQLLQELVRSSSLGEGERAPAEPVEPERLVIEITPGQSLNDVSRAVETQYFRELYLRAGERFEIMARRLLEGDPDANARRVQLRFNNLGLSTRRLRKGDPGAT
jgi:DNA-binding NtrC family response regulator